MQKLIYGFPVTQQYKYLGVIIDDKLNFNAEIARRKFTKKALAPKHWILQHNRLTEAAKMQLWYALFRAKWFYGAQVLAIVNPKC